MKHEFQLHKPTIESEFSKHYYLYDTFCVDPAKTRKNLKASIDEIGKDDSFYLATCKKIKYLFENAPIIANENSLFADRIADFSLMERNRDDKIDAFIKEYPFERMDEIDLVHYKYKYIIPVWDFGHNSIDWRKLFNLGFTGLKAEAEKHLEDKNLTKEQIDFYKGVSLALEGVINLCKRFANAVGNKSENAKFMYNNLMGIATDAPKTFSEGLQLILITFYSLTFVESTYIRTFGRIDETLYDLYISDLSKGVTEEDLKEMLRYFFYRIECFNYPANIPQDLSGHTFCGKENPLSLLILDVLDEIKPVNIKTHIDFGENTPKKFMYKVLDMVARQSHNLMFANEKIISLALQNIGVTKEDADRNVITGCFEPVAEGTEIGGTCGVRINLAKTFELALNGGYDMKDNVKLGAETLKAEYITDYETFIKVLKEQLAYAIELGLQNEDYFMNNCYREYKVSPIFSSVMADCMKKGTDAYSGGAKYCDDSLIIACLASFVDSISVIKKFCFNEKRLTLAEFRDILKNNWEGNEKFRMECFNCKEKYGNNIAEVDNIAKEFIEYASNLVNGKPNPMGGVYRLGCCSIDWRLWMGELTAATADGRKCGEPLSKNSTPAIGQDRNGVTAAILSGTSFDNTLLPDGEILDIMIHPTAIKGEDGLDILYSLIKTYFNKGGMCLNINCLNAETLIDAQRHPENYQNLQVRRCGWNEKFVYLTKAEQDFLISQAGGNVEC